MIIGIIGAMEDEVAALKEAMEVRRTVSIASMEFVEGTLEGKDVVVVRSGVGKVNAGICAQILALQFQVDVLINTGIAGSLDARIDIGDLVGVYRHRLSRCGRRNLWLSAGTGSADGYLFLCGGSEAD